jgi:predicted esterase
MKSLHEWRLFNFTPMQSSELSFEFKARYFKIGQLDSNTKAIWIVLHGYGQLAQFFLRNFSLLEKHNICVIAPEGLSRFYLEDIQSRSQSGNNRVGSTWMTKENRAMDIKNYLTYLNTLYIKEVGNSTLPITILGFSQGAATATRWVLDRKIRFDRLILWAGVLPPDMDFDSGKETLADKEILFVYGKEDAYLNDDRFGEMKQLSEKLQIKPQIIEFDGAHQMNENVLSQLI